MLCFMTSLAPHLRFQLNLLFVFSQARLSQGLHTKPCDLWSSEHSLCSGSCSSQPQSSKQKQGQTAALETWVLQPWQDVSHLYFHYRMYWLYKSHCYSSAFICNSPHNTHSGHWVTRNSYTQIWKTMLKITSILTYR